MSLLHSRVLNRRLHGWMLQLLEFDFVIKYRPGVENSDADALSRQDWDSKMGATWIPDLDEEDQGLRAAQSFVVGGDVGTEPHRSTGVATSGVALQEPAKKQYARKEGSVQRPSGGSVKKQSFSPTPTL